MGQFVRVAETSELPPGSAKLVEAGGCSVAVFCLEGAYYALEDRCPHRGGSLSQGMILGSEVSCPWHGARFDIKTGAVQCPPAQQGVRSFPVRLSGNDVEVEI